MSLKLQAKRSGFFSGVAGKIFRKIVRNLSTKEYFFSSSEYWESRYASGGGSGVGSYDKFAEFKAGFINKFVLDKNVKSVIEFGCGDGNQLSLADYPAYIGFDISLTAIELCRSKFPDSAVSLFKPLSEFDLEKADLSLSLDVIFHLVEDDIFESYMRALFGAANRYVIIYASDSDDNALREGAHVMHRKFTRWVEKNIFDFKLIECVLNKYPYYGDCKNGSFSDFYVYEKSLNVDVV